MRFASRDSESRTGLARSEQNSSTRDRRSRRFPSEACPHIRPQHVRRAVVARPEHTHSRGSEIRHDVWALTRPESYLPILCPPEATAPTRSSDIAVQQKG